MTAASLLEESDPEPGRMFGPPSASRVELANSNRYPEAQLRQLRPWLERLVASVACDRPGTLSVRFIGDREMTRLNREFRGKDRTTDVLSFPGSETMDGPHLGDIAVSVPRARSQALDRGHSVARELQVLLIHGLLHCLGYDHETDDGRMNQVERGLQRKWVQSDE